MYLGIAALIGAEILLSFKTFSFLLDVRYAVAIVLLLVNGLWKIIRSGRGFETLEEQYQSLSQQDLDTADKSEILSTFFKNVPLTGL